MWLSSFVILRWFDFSSFVKRLNMVFMPLLHDRYVEFGSFRKFMGFSASHVMFATIKDLKYSLQRDEFPC